MALMGAENGQDTQPKTMPRLWALYNLDAEEGKAMTNNTKKVKVWECKIVVPADAELPSGFDWPPRSAACAAVESAGIEVLGCSSGWGGSLTESEQMAFENQAVGGYDAPYYAGLMDTKEDNPQ